MSRCVEITIKVYPLGEKTEGIETEMPAEDGRQMIIRTLTDDSPREFCTKLHKYIYDSSNKKVLSTRESKTDWFPIPLDEQKVWCKYI